ncbi:MAG: hypothetical protein Q9173_006883, partial [Seirophora scorigena]
GNTTINALHHFHPSTLLHLTPPTSLRLPHSYILPPFAFTSPGGQFQYTPPPPQPAQPAVVPTNPDVVPAPAAQSGSRLSRGTRSWMRQQAWYRNERTSEENLAGLKAKTLRKQRNAKIHREKDVCKAKKASALEEGRTTKEIEKLKKQVEALRSETKEKETETLKREIEAFNQRTAEEKKAAGYAAVVADQVFRDGP